MNKPNFTPGPWVVDVYKNDMPPYPNYKRAIFSARQNEKSIPIALVKGDPRPAEVNDANAHLISAAPDMYEALKMFLNHPLQITHSIALHEETEKAKAAIKKAEGREDE